MEISKEAFNPSASEAVKYYEGMCFTDDFSEKTIRAVNMNKLAIEALRKQTPMRPTMTGDDDSDSYNCPNCRSFVAYVDSYESEKMPFCSCCGQRLLWDSDNLAEEINEITEQAFAQMSKLNKATINLDNGRSIVVRKFHVNNEDRDACSLKLYCTKSEMKLGKYEEDGLMEITVTESDNKDCLRSAVRFIVKRNKNTPVYIKKGETK